MIQAYVIIDHTGFRRVGGCLSPQDLQQIVDGYPVPVQSVTTYQIPKERYDAWRDNQDQL